MKIHAFPSRPLVSQTDVERAFGEFAAANGFTIPNVRADGRIHRFDAYDGARRKKGRGWYVLYADGKPNGVVGDWGEAGQNLKWSLDLPAGVRIDAREAQRIREESDRRREQEYAAAAAGARAICAAATPADPAHPYLMRKQIEPHGALMDADGSLVIPLLGEDGLIWTFQRIDASGTKRFHTGGKAGGARCYLGAPIGHGAPIIVCEGFATAASIAEAIPCAAVVATMSAHNLEPVARHVRRLRPDAAIVIAADDDAETKGNPGIAAATAAAEACGGVVARPAIGGHAGKLDFNDMANALGADRVAEILADAASRAAPGRSSTRSAINDEDVGGGPPHGGDSGRRVVELVDGQLSRIVDEVNDSLAGDESLEIYRTPEGLVRVHVADREIQRWRANSGDDAPSITTVREHVSQPLDAHQIRYLAGRCVSFLAYDKRSKGLKEKDCPSDVALTVRSLGGRQTDGFRDLDAIVNGPQLRPDGTIMSAPGYDALTRTLFVGRADAFPAVKDRPTPDDARDALATLLELLDEFPFVRDDEDRALFDAPGDRRSASRSVALAAMLTAVSRHAVPHAPAFGISARAPGTGKSYLADLISALAAGRLASVYAFADKPEEFDKRLDAALLAHEALVAIDNVAGGAALGHPKLEQIITQPEVTVRRLGGSDQFKVRPRAIVLATGNNLMARGDMTRRILMATLDAEDERPEQRAFKGDPVSDALANRGRYVHAALTILRAYVVAGRPPQDVPALAGFEQWSRTVRAALVWLGEADPVRTMEVARASDPIREQLLAVLDAWAALPIAAAAVTAGELIKRAKELANAATGGGNVVAFNDAVPAAEADTALLDAIRGVAAKGNDVCPYRFGNWLSEFKGRRITIGEGRDARVAWFEAHGKSHKVKTYRLCSEAKGSRATPSGGLMNGRDDEHTPGDFLV